MGLNVVWFKRDLRVQDHAPLCAAVAASEAALAAGQGRTLLCLYVLEPSLWAQPDSALAHFGFLRESLRDLALQLRACGADLHLAVGEVPEVLAQLHATRPVTALYAHEETGNGPTYARDRAVARWCRDNGVAWTEWPQHGVVRRLVSRNDWAKRWRHHMQAPQWPTPEPGRLRGLALGRDQGPWPTQAWPNPGSVGLDHVWALGETRHDPPQRQRGGRTQGLAVWHDFLSERSRHYRGGISSPLTAPTACSRLSPYLALGALGMREVVQATETRLRDLAADPHPSTVWQRKGLAGFLSRLHWHCHFIQKLESEPALESRNLHRSYDGLREPDWNPQHFAALVAGRTGWPLVDACVALLRDTGWINFRMRAMLVSVAAYPLWLHWRPVGLWLARQFVDYEPGIHWSQMQMQSGTTGINTTRVYNPVKQAQDHDPQGHFVRRWLPAMRRVPDAWLFEPWRMTPSVQAACGVRVGEDIPQPVVDLGEATRAAKARLHALRAQPEVRAAKAAIVDKHGSRKRRLSPKTPAAPAMVQHKLALD